MSRRKSERIVLDAAELMAIVERTKTSALTVEEYEKLKASVETLVWVEAELEKKNASLKRIRKALSLNTKKTEKTSEVLKGAGATESPQGNDEERSGEKPEKKKKKPKGHGRNGADAYEGAGKTQVPHESLKPGDSCPECETTSAKVYPLINPVKLVRVRGQAPIQAEVYELEGLRCNLCGKVFRAKAPEEVGEKKYDETSASMIGLLKYGTGLPFNRLARLMKSFKIPLPTSTQWDIIRKAAIILMIACEELIRQAAQWDIFYNDDTSIKILQLLKENQQIEQAGSKERTGIFTSAIVASCEDHKIAVFFTGRQHAGENLADVLRHRAKELERPMHMCDGLSRNVPKDFADLLIKANCMAHGRRKFVEVAENFPQECLHVLKSLCRVYRNDATARKEKMSPEDRLRFHQDHSAKVMTDLESWMNEQLEERKVEPNSSLGSAFSYMIKRWDKLTLFLRKPGAPLDNNICERALKKAVLHRKNALFYKTEKGARVADTFMSLIYTAELEGVDPFDYLTELLKHPEELRRSPQDWMPWNYQAAVAAAEVAVAQSDVELAA
ncbi:MAG: IS66 family transposase [Actinomycetia bacterium]|nr:IS66 family transposase [Actinomycetes bacterium]